MGIGLLFWIVYLIAVIFSGWSLRAGGPLAWGGSLVLYVLLGLLGWASFGPPVHG